MTNSVTLLDHIGPNATHPNAISVQAQFIESAIDAASGTSSVTVVVKLINNNDNIERFYSYWDAYLNITVGGVTAKIGHPKCRFDLKGGRSATIDTMTFNNVNHASGSVAVSFHGVWPQYYIHTVNASGTLALTPSTQTATPVPPTPPVWPSNGNAIGPGAGTSTYLNWIPMANVSRSGAAQVSPYDTMTLLVSQASYPSHFNPILLGSDLGQVPVAGQAGGHVPGGGGHLAASNYGVVAFWYTALGKTLPSTPQYLDVADNQLLTVQCPGNPPAIATGWGLAVARSTTGGADIATATIQGTSPLRLGSTWIEPIGGLTSTGGAPPSSGFADDLAWSQNVAVPLDPTTSKYVYPTIPGFWYQFALTVGNAAGWSTQTPQVYYVPGTAPSLGANGSNQAGEANVNVVYAPMANIAVVGQAFNRLNASASVQPIVAQVIDFAKHTATLTQSATPLTLVNYSGDPRAYGLFQGTGGNNTASPYVAEANVAGFTSHNTQPLPTSMSYALQALGLAPVDRGHTMTFVAANNNTGSQVSSYVYIGGNPDAANANASLPIPSGANSVQVSALAWINSANVAPGRTVTPFDGIRFTALDSSNTVVGSNTVAVPAMAPNTLKQLSAGYVLPANTARVVAALVANTAAGANWTGGYQAGDSITTTGFMVLFDGQPNTPYFDGGFPYSPTYTIHTSADLAQIALGAIPNTREGHAAGFP